MTQSLSAEEIAELLEARRVAQEALSVPGPLTQRGYEARRAFSDLMYKHEAALLAMASRLVEIESRPKMTADHAEAEAMELFEAARPDTARRSRNESQRGETQLTHSSGEVEEAFVDGYLAAMKKLGWPGPTSQAKGG